MRSTRQVRPAVEDLESRKVPSAGASAAAAAHLAPAIVAQASSTTVVLVGQARGIAVNLTSNPDVGKAVFLNGGGFVSHLGNVSVSGQVHGTGFIATGHATGTVTLSNALGRVKLQLTGPTQPGFSPFPATFTYKIVEATGRYKGLTGNGHADLVIVTAPPPKLPPGVLTFIPVSPFTLTFRKEEKNGPGRDLGRLARARLAGRSDLG
jgi:hypothetical protein